MPNMPIRRKLILMNLLISGAALLLTCGTFVVHEFLTFRQALVANVTSLSRVVAASSTAALAFDNEEDALQTLNALRAETHITHAALYDANGNLFAKYPVTLPASNFPAFPNEDGYSFVGSGLIAAQPVVAEGKRWGTLYMRSDSTALAQRLRVYGAVTLTVLAVAMLVAYVLSRTLQHQISGPLSTLAETARAVAERGDYSVRAPEGGRDELGLLTQAVNRMLSRIQQQDGSVRTSEARLRAVLDSAITAVIVIDAAGLIRDWNSRAETLFGWSRSEVLGHDMADTIIPEQYRAAHRRGLQHAGRGHSSSILNRVIEFTALRRDGGEFPVELSISVLDTDDAPCFCGFITDITERKLARDKRQEQLFRLDLLQRITRAIGERQDLTSIFDVVLRNLEENLPIEFGCIGLRDPAAGELTVDSVGARGAAYAADLGLKPHSTIEIESNALSEIMRGQLVYESDTTAASSAFASRFARAELHSVVIAPLLAESSVIGLLIVALRKRNGFSSSACEFLRQLGEHVALAAHQTQLYRDLQRAYEELRLSQQAVVQQERLRALGQIASGVAHDINNAISPVALYTETLLESEPGLSDRGRGYLETISRAIDDVAQTVSRMREFYRPHAADLLMVRVDLNVLVRQTIELTRARWRDVPQQRGAVIEMHAELAQNLPRIMGIEGEIRDALTNLIFNAVDAMPEGGVLTVATRSTRSGHAQLVWLEVRDTGIGMNVATQQRCLEPFFTTKGERGSGLGLAMVYGMTQRHGAELEVDSAPGCGTRMAVAFPAAGAGVEPDVRPTVVPRPTPAARILIVDDDLMILDSLRATLESDGHQVFSADGGQNGIDTFAEAHRAGRPFTLVITDLGMPYVDGRRVAAAIKAISSSTPVVMLTGWGRRLIDDSDTPAHVDVVLSKPPKLQELRSALAELLPVLER